MTKREVVWAELSCMYSAVVKTKAEKQDEYTDQIVSVLVEDDELTKAIKSNREVMAARRLYG